LLDIGCATGELVFFAEDLGMSTAGIDNDEYLLEIAGTKKERNFSDAEFIKGDMRLIDGLFKNRNFDIITCMGNTLAHLGSAEEVSGFFRSVNMLLNEKGVFTCQIVNYDKPVPEGKTNFKEIESDEFRFIRNNEILKEGESVKFSGELILKSDGRKYRSEILLFPVSRDLIEKELNESGFNSIKIYGGFDRNSYDLNSDALVFRAEK